MTIQKLSRIIHQFFRFNNISNVSLSFIDEYGFPHFEISCRFQTNRSGTEITQWMINIPEVEPDTYTRDHFNTFLRERLGVENFETLSDNTWHFLHEIGHIFTLEKYVTPKQNRVFQRIMYNKMKDDVRKAKLPPYENDKRYFEYPSELEATNWMIANYEKLIRLEELNQTFIKYFERSCLV